MITARVGAPITLSVMVVSWGIVAASTSAVKTVNQFYALRFLLGMCEAGKHKPLDEFKKPHMSLLLPLILKRWKLCLMGCIHLRENASTSYPF